MVTAVKPVETKEERMQRFAERARTNGCRVLIESNTEEAFVTSATMENIIYRVTKTTCSCAGHRAYGRCQHRALYLDFIGELPPLYPEPAWAPSGSCALTPEAREPQGYHTATGDALRRVTIARSEVVRLSRDPKSTADWHRLNNARERLESLTTPFVAAAA